MSADLENLLRGPWKRILFVGVGNVLRQDDGVGVYISSRIKENVRIKSLTVEVSLENYLGKINSINPDILVILDCVDMKTTPGESALIEAGKTADLTFNTHNISISKLTGFFKFPSCILGIQPFSIDFGENISYLVMEEANKIVQLINKQEVQNGY